MLHKNITDKVVAILVINILTVSALEFLFIFRNTKYSNHIPFYVQKGFKKKGVNWC